MLGIVGVLGLLLVGSAFAGDIPFAPQVVISTDGRLASDAVAADLDGDGDLDVLAGTTVDDTIRWFENDGSPGTQGDWTVHTVSSAALDVISLVAADVDADGDLDIVYASDLDGRIEWIENTTGDGSSWTPHRISIVPQRAQSVFVADLDGDADLDVLSASLDDDRIAWYENDGTPASPEDWLSRDISTAIDGAASVAAADLDADGDLDVLSSSLFPAALDTVSWHENTAGDGSLWTKHPIATRAGGARSVSAVDMDRDGDLDVLAASEASDRISWYENDGTPRDSTEWPARDVSTSEDGVRAVLATDLDADGDPDVLAASAFDGNRVAWYENTAADGSLWTARTISSEVTGGTAIEAADLDGDGDPDVISASQNDDKVAWYENLTLHRSAIHPHSEEVSTLADGVRSLHPADVDGDGDLDLLSASRVDDTVSWHERSPGGSPAWTRHAISTSEDGAFGVVAVDLDRDGDLDVVSASFDDDTVAWHENAAGDGSAWMPHPITTAADGAIAVATADLDRDGDPDVVSASIWDDTVSWHENASGDGMSWIVHPITNAADGAAFVVAVDLDRDGDQDVLSASLLDDTVAWYENTGGDGSAWAPHTISTSADGVESIFVSDVDADGDPDVLAASFNDDAIRWYENALGDASVWTPHTISTSADGANGVFAADLDGDGDVDALSASLEDDSIAWYENLSGDGSLWMEHAISTTALGAVFVLAADLDGDGDLDPVSASTSDDTVAWYENRGGQFALATQDTAPAELLAGAVEDVLRIEVAHRGRPGDGDLELASLELRLEEGSGVPLTSSQANALMASLRVYVDDGSGSFETGADALVASASQFALADGLLTVTLPDGDARLRVSSGETLTVFVVVELALAAAQATPNRVQVTHVTEATSRAEDRDHDIALSLEYVGNVASAVVQALGVACSDGIDNDGDRLADHPDDPGCDSPADVSERSPGLLCDDGGDNDGDGRADFPADRGCVGPTDDSEESDRDQDGFIDSLDNCVDFANANQWDSNGDGLGNACDADLNDDGFVDSEDLDVLRALVFTTDPDADLNGDGIVNYGDLAQMKRLYLREPRLSGPLSSAPMLSNLRLAPAAFPTPGGAERFVLTVEVDFEDPDRDLSQLILLVEGPQGPVRRILGDLRSPSTVGSARRSLTIDSSFLPGLYTVRAQLIDSVENASNVESRDFTVAPGVAPPIALTGFSPSTGRPGDTIVFTGSGFASVAEETLLVSFHRGNRSAEIVALADDELQVIVPEGAVTGPIDLESPLGVVRSPSVFTVDPTITVSPESHELLRGESVELSCTVSGTATKEAQWSIASGSEPELGTIDERGRYTAPDAIPPTNPVVVRCRSADVPALFAEAQIQILPPPPEPGLGTILAGIGGEVSSEEGEVGVAFPPGGFTTDTVVSVQVPSEEDLPPEADDTVHLASLVVEAQGVAFGEPATGTFALRHWVEPGTVLEVRELGTSGPAAAAQFAIEAVVDQTGLKAVAQVARSGMYAVEGMLALPRSRAEDLLQAAIGSRGFRMTRPRNTELLEGLRIPVVVEPDDGQAGEGIGPFFEGVRVEATLDGVPAAENPLRAGPLVQPDATGWKLGTFVRIPVLTDCGLGESRGARLHVYYSSDGAAAELSLPFQFDCLDELVFDGGQSPNPMPIGGVWEWAGFPGRLALAQGTHRFSQIEIGAGGTLAALPSSQFASPLTLEVTSDVRVNSLGQIAMDFLGGIGNAPDDLRAPCPWWEPGIFPLEPGPQCGPGAGHFGFYNDGGGDGGTWYGGRGGRYGDCGSCGDDGEDGRAALVGGAGGAGGTAWEFTSSIALAFSGFQLLTSLLTEDWVGAALEAYDLVNTSVKIGRNDENRLSGAGRGGRRAHFAQRSVNDPPQAGGGGGGSGKAYDDCSFLFIDFCPDDPGSGGGGGGGGAHPLDVRAGGDVVVEFGASITGNGGPGGLGAGGFFDDNAPGGGGAGGNGAYIRIQANEVFNLGRLSAAGGTPGLSQICPNDFGVGVIGLIDGEFCGGSDVILFPKGIGEKGHDGVFRILARLRGQLPAKGRLSGGDAPGDPWGQRHDFAFPGLGDFDGDGLKDGLEQHIGTDDRSADPDLDGLTDYEEVLQTGTDPNLRDTDGDGLSDGDELAADPFVTDPLNADTDGDEASDGFELDKGSDPLDPNSTPEVCDGQDNDLDGATDEDCEIRLDHKGTEFFIPFMPTLSGAPDPTLKLLITSDGFADVTVEYPVGTELETVQVTPDQPREVTIPSSAATTWQPWNPNFPLPVASNAVRVTASFEVTVVAQNKKTFVADRALALPTELLGQEYRVMTWGIVPLSAQAEFVVVAVEDQTSLTVDDLPFPGGPLAVTLDRGEGFLVQSGLGLQGTRIVADKKVVVANGNDCVSIGGKYCEHLYEIALPVERWGTDYLARSNRSEILQSGFGLQRSYYRVLVAQDGTELNVNGTLVASFLGAGAVVDLSPGDFLYRFDNHFSASKPILVVQFMSSVCDEWPSDPTCSDPNSFENEVPGDASMTNLVPTGRFPKVFRFTGVGCDGWTTGLNVIAPTPDAQSESVLVDGVPISAFEFTAFPSAPAWSVATLEVDATFSPACEDLHTSQSPNGHSLTLIGIGFNSAVTAPLGYDYDQ